MTTDTPSVGMRILVGFGALVLLVIGGTLAVTGLLGLDTASGRALLLAGLAALVAAVGGIAGQVADARARRDPPAPTLTRLGDEAALLLPRAPGPTLVSSWVLAALAALAGVAAVSCLLGRQWVPAVVLASVALWLGVSSAVHRGGRLAGGLWFTPTRLRHDYRGRAVEVPWDDVTGVVPQQPMPVLVRPDRPPVERRTGPPGRSWRTVRPDGMLGIDTRHLSGGPAIASYVIGRAVTDPASRRVLGTPESLPPR